MEVKFFKKKRDNAYQAPNLLKDFFLDNGFEETKKPINFDKKNIFKIFYLRIKKFLIFIYKVQFEFGLPKKKSIVIFDDITNEISYILPRKIYHKLDVRNEEIKKLFINIYIIKFVILNFFKRNLKMNYLIALINNINPKLVITFIDNSYTFYELSKIFKDKISFLGVQNANRGDYSFLSISQKKQIYHQKLFSLGLFEHKIFKKYNLNINSELGGSLRNAIFIKKYPVYKKKKNVFDICLIGKNLVKAGLHNKYSSYEDDIIPDSLILLNNLKKYLEKNKRIKLVICCKSYGFRLKAEKYFYKKFFKGFNVSISINSDRIDNKNFFNSYKQIVKSSLVIGLNSTLLREAFYFDKKVLCVDFNKNRINPFKKIALVSSKSYQVFEKNLDYLNKINYTTYLNKLNYQKNHIIGKINTIKKIKTFIDKVTEI